MQSVNKGIMTTTTRCFKKKLINLTLSSENKAEIHQTCESFLYKINYVGFYCKNVNV